MRQAVIELKAAVGKMRDDLYRTEQSLEVERRSLDDAERRGRLATGIGDRETVEVAERFAAKHAERVRMLEQKMGAQRAELELAERELDEMTEQFKAMERGVGTTGNRPPIVDVADELLQGNIDRAAQDARAEAQLRELKRKMGK